MSTFPAVRRWFQAHPYALDALIAALTLGMIILAAVHPSRGPDSPPPADLGPLEVAVAVAASAVLVWRRRAPRTVLALAGVLTIGHVIMTAGDPRSPIAMSVVVALYTVASRTDRHTTWRVAVLTIGVLTGALMIFGERSWYADENLGVFAWTGMAAGIGDAVRSRRAFVEAIQERAERAEATRDQEARRRVTEERMRIARELHDVVAHHIALVNVQAGVASHVMDARPDQAKEALAHVREASRSALEELRTTVGLLRQSDDPAAPKEPAPGLGVLDQLVDGFVRAGVPVAVEVSVDGALPKAVDLTAYRVLQEALTNVHKHAGPAARVEARVLQYNGTLEVTVTDDGLGPRDECGDGGHGLIGMRERTSALGGSCRAGARADGSAGYEVQVRLPLQARTDGGGR